MIPYTNYTYIPDKWLYQHQTIIQNWETMQQTLQTQGLTEYTTQLNTIFENYNTLITTMMGLLDNALTEKIKETPKKIAETPVEYNVYGGYKPQFGSAKGMIIIPDDFDEPLDDFSEYME